MFSLFVFLKHGLEGALPTGTQGRDTECTEQLIAAMSGQIEQRVNLGHGHAHRSFADLDNLIPAAYFAFLQHAEVEAGPVVRYQQGGHARLIHPDADAIAGNAGLRHLEECATDAIAIADANFIVGKAFDGEVLAELTIDEVGTSELFFPEAVGFNLIDEDGALLTAVTRQVALAVPVDVESANLAPALDRTLPYPCVDSLTLPRNVAREADVNGQ